MCCAIPSHRFATDLGFSELTIAALIGYKKGIRYLEVCASCRRGTFAGRRRRVRSDCGVDGCDRSAGRGRRIAEACTMTTDDPFERPHWTLGEALAWAIY